MKGKVTKIMAGTLLCAMTVGFAAACGGDDVRLYDNENDAVVFSTQPVDGVFNPFFATSGTDMSVLGMTQISMLANDENGNIAYGITEPVVVEDMEITTSGIGENARTEYKFVLKNNIKFSNGSYLSMKDVLFNLYVYLDPVYTGSTTMYSTDIVGLKAYRTQTPDSAGEGEQDAFMGRFQDEANTRIEDLLAAYTAIYQEHDNVGDADGFRALLESQYASGKPNIVADYDKTIELFQKELNNDFTNSLDSYAETVFQDSTGKEHKGVLHSDVEMFLYNENVLQWDKKAAQIKPESWPADRDANGVLPWTKEQAIQYVFDLYVPGRIDEVLTNWATAGDLQTYITNAALETFIQNNEGRRTIKSIEGIKFANKDQKVTVRGKEYDVPQYADAAHTHVQDGYNEVLSITIHKIDPKAIWNFAFTVAPLFYYSDEAHINAFDYTENFGVEYGSQTFYNNVVGASAKNGVPVGAGPYAASCDTGGIARVAGGDANVESGDFYNGSMIYYERNPYYNPDGKTPGGAKIKKVRYLVAQQSQMLTMLQAGDMDFVEPNAKTDTFNQVRGLSDQGIGYREIQTSGYGYIGINAGYVPNLKVRQAIMHCIDTKLTAQYYGTHAEVLYRSMTKANWVYDLALRDKTSYYPYIGDPIPEDLDVVNPDYKNYVDSIGKQAGDRLTEQEQENFIRGLIEGEGYTENAERVYTKGNDTLRYTFTIVGSEKDHPAWDALWAAGQMLNNWGFKISVKTDPQGLIKLNTGSLAVWAAAWGSTIDPDMYQVYHWDSTATSVYNWGYRQIRATHSDTKYATEYDIIVNQLSPLIEQAREIDDSTDAGKQERADLYARALDLVMQLAIELPTYQRNDLFVYNSNKFDQSTFFQAASPFKGLTSDIHTISLNVAQ